ncbi:MAG: UDP-N-acetyl-D-mannosamine dehydrogenase [Nitrospirales bacterium]|nr:MAG: UDP-N-acetyl-D-mannosamine dehydrogenase [Nitrospirales bacterium]
MEFKKISVVGLGYIGLPTAAAFASRGVEVIGVDVNEKAIEIINRGEIHIVEPELDRYVHEAVSNGRLRATSTAECADAFLIAVPTPFKGDDHEPDLKYIQSAARSIASVLKKGNLVILESTSPVGATEQMAEWLAEYCPELSFPQSAGENSDIRIAHCPERVLPGQVMKELVTNDRVIGGMTPACSSAAVSLYKIFVEGECVITNTRTAEMAKLTENASRDVSIAFANELSLLCDTHGIDVWELIQLANRHPRVNILEPGPGVGGHCIAVDPWFIVSSSPEDAKLIKQARLVNDGKPEWVKSKVVKLLNGLNAEERSVACFGITFKPNIDDVRESPALSITEYLASQEGITLNIVEPNLEMLPDSLAGRQNCNLVDYDYAIENSNVIVILVDHSEFRDIATHITHQHLVVDTKGLVSKAKK